MTLLHRYVFFGLVILSCWGLVIRYIQLYVNVTHSMPYSFFIGLRHTNFSLKRGDYVAFVHPLYPNRNLIKRIEGIPGDSIQRQNQIVIIHGTPFPTRSKTPQQESVIPKGQYFVSGTHERSYDSRYDSFGLLHRSQIQGVVWPLF